MRVFLFFVLVLVAGFAAGVVADRVEPTKSLLTEHAGTVIDQFIAPPPPPVEPVETSPLPLEEGAERLSAAELAAFGIEPCFPKRALPAAADRPWLTRQTQVTTVFDRGALPPSPDLSDYPGLIKIEGIRSETGAEREHCAAVRMAKHWFLTAAHCVLDLNFDTGPRTIDVIAITPSDDVNEETTKVVSVTGALCHSAYRRQGRQYSNDIAVLYLEDVSAFEAVEIATLETAEHGLIPFDFRRTYISGWGKNGGARYLQGGPIAILDAGEAVLVGERIGPRGPNVGDSGAPLYLARDEGPIVVGTLSQVTQDRDQNGDRSIYVRTKAMHDWVSRTMAICAQNGAYVCAPNIPAATDDANAQKSVADSL